MCEIRVGRYSGDECPRKSGTLRTFVGVEGIARMFGEI
jgi:hypothetical protein